MSLKRPRDRGLAIVELAIVLPLFMVILFAIFDFGMYFFVKHTVQYATREGMRVALVGKRLPDDSGDLMSREDTVISTIREKASFAVDASALSVYVYPVAVDYGDPGDWDDAEPDAGAPGIYMRVRSRYLYTFITPIIGAFFPGGQALVEAQGTYRNELFDA
jgi:hypothetical protein